MVKALAKLKISPLTGLKTPGKFRLHQKLVSTQDQISTLEARQNPETRAITATENFKIVWPSLGTQKSSMRLRMMMTNSNSKRRLITQILTSSRKTMKIFVRHQKTLKTTTMTSNKARVSRMHQ